MKKGLCSGGALREVEKEAGIKSDGERRGRSAEMIPLSNPVDTRLVWLPTRSEGKTEAGGGCKAHTEREAKWEGTTR